MYYSKCFLATINIVTIGKKEKNGKVRTCTQLEYVDIIYYNRDKKKKQGHICSN